VRPLRPSIAMALAAALTMSLGATPTVAHHSFGRYDMAKTAEVEGAVVKFEWSNPHSWLFITARAADGTRIDYGFEMSSVGELLRRGWTKTALKPGEAVKISYHPLRDSSLAGLLMSATRNGELIGKPIRGPEPPPAPQSPQPSPQQAP
jgi:hypothetical protein